MFCLDLISVSQHLWILSIQCTGIFFRKGSTNLVKIRVKEPMHLHAVFRTYTLTGVHPKGKSIVHAMKYTQYFLPCIVVVILTWFRVMTRLIYPYHKWLPNRKWNILEGNVWINLYQSTTKHNKKLIVISVPFMFTIHILKTKNCHDVDFVVTDGTSGCRHDNRRCHQWQQSWH